MPARIFPTPQDKVPHTTFPPLPAWWSFKVIIFFSLPHQAFLETNTDRHILLPLSISFSAAKAQKSVTGKTMKKCHDLLKNLGRKEANDAKSLQVAGNLFKGSVPDTLGKCILLMKK